MAGQKSGQAPGKTPYEPGGAEVWSDSDHDYFTDPLFTREASFNQIKQRGQDKERLYDLKTKTAPRFANGGMVKHGSSTRVSCTTKHKG